MFIAGRETQSIYTDREMAGNLKRFHYCQSSKQRAGLIDTIRRLAGEFVGQVDGSDIIDFGRLRAPSNVLVGDGDAEFLVA